MSRGVAPHQLVESGFTGTVDLKAAALVVRDAALTGGHDRDRSICGDAFAERFDNAHRAERVGEHETSELFVRDVHGGLPTTVGDARVDEEEGPLVLDAVLPYLTGKKDPFEPVLDLSLPAARHEQTLRLLIIAQ